MARDDRFKKAQQAGADWLETARARAEEFLRELSRASDNTQGRAQGAIDDLVEGSRRGTEHLVTAIRNEITTQLGLLGLATKSDLANLERRLTGKVAKAAPAKKAAPKKAAAGAQSSTKKAAAKKAPAKKAAAAKKTAG